MRVANVFHAGDGNLHPLILYDANKPGEIERAEAFGADILRLCVAVGGVLTGEHGVGVEKRDLMRAMFDETDLAQQQRLKCAFDPDGLLNPGKVFPNLRRCAELGRLHVHRGGLAAPGFAAFLAAGRQLGVLRQIVGDLEPRRLAVYEDLACRPNAGLVIRCRQRDAELGQRLRVIPRKSGMRLGAVQDRRSAPAAEPAPAARRRLGIGQQRLAANPFEVAAAYARPAAKRGTMLLAAKGAMAIQRPQHRVR